MGGQFGGVSGRQVSPGQTELPLAGTPGPRPFSGFTISALPPSAAIVSAVLTRSRTGVGCRGGAGRGGPRLPHAPARRLEGWIDMLGSGFGFVYFFFSIPALSLRNCFAHDEGGAKHISSDLTNAQTFGKLFFEQVLGLVSRQPTVCFRVSFGFKAA